jgi:hypothetical protein
MTVHGNGDLPEGEGAGINVAERLLTLLLDGVLEGADRLCICNFDREYFANIVVKYPAVELPELECGRHEVLFRLSDDAGSRKKLEAIGVPAGIYRVE